MTDIERYQAMTTDELIQEMDRLFDQIRLKLEACPPTPAINRFRQRFAETIGIFRQYQLSVALRKHKEAKQ